MSALPHSQVYGKRMFTFAVHLPAQVSNFDSVNEPL